MQVFPSKRREGNSTERYLRGLRNQNGQHFVNIAKTLFPVENKNDKYELTNHRVKGDGCIYLQILAESVSQCSSKF